MTLNNFSSNLWAKSALPLPAGTDRTRDEEGKKDMNREIERGWYQRSDQDVVEFFFI